MLPSRTAADRRLHGLVRRAAGRLMSAEPYGWGVHDPMPR
jgi:hypothetical protein